MHMKNSTTFFSLRLDDSLFQRPRVSREGIVATQIHSVNIKVIAIGIVSHGFVETRIAGDAIASVRCLLYETINRSRTVGSIEIRWCLNDSSLPFGNADKVIVVSCSLIGVFAWMLSAMVGRRMTLRCSRRDSLRYFLELTSEKLWPRPRELRSDDRRCRSRIFFMAQHNRYLMQIPKLYEYN